VQDETSPAREVRSFGAMDLDLERRDDVSVVVRVYLATLLVDITLLTSDVLEWRFDTEAGGAQARGNLRLALSAPGFFSTIHGDLEYTAAGTWNRYRGLLSHWAAQSALAAGAPPAPVSPLVPRRSA
jgi:hypothetical protein